jgi:DNA repair exonuclease SbcCD ATPase subunit
MRQLYLPNLKKIKVNEYTLYQQEPTFEYDFKVGTNAVIGANGIGKTTFVNIIIYCLVGHKKKKFKINKNTNKNKLEYVDEDFFSSRIDNSANDFTNLSAAATLEFSLGNTQIIITRSLVDNNINSLIIDGNEVNEPNDIIYQNIIEDLSNISQFQDFEVLVREFLFFDEQRNNVAWEIDSQDNILRILLLDEQYHLKINDLEDKITKADTKGRHKSEDKRVAEASYNELVAAKDDVVKQSVVATEDTDTENDNIEDHEANRQKLVLKRNELNSQLLNRKEELASEQEKFNELTQENLQIEGTLSNLSAIYDNVMSEIKRLETDLYKSIYNKLPDYYFTIEKNMLAEGKCLVCNAKSREIQHNATMLKQNGKCLVCSSKLVESVPVDSGIVEQLNILNEEKKERLNQLNNQKNKQEKLSSKLYESKNSIFNLKTIISDLERAKVVIESELNKDEPENGKPDMYNEILKNKEKIINELDKEVREAYQERDNYKKELIEYTQKFKAVINNLNQRLSSYFNKYASTFLGLDCKLSVTGKTLNKIPHFYYVPEIDGQIRKDIWSVSESQRFFIDQAFRMAIIEYLQANITNFSTFFITETPEGSLDIAYESQVAMMFNIFSKSNNKIIFTSNLNSSNFMKELYRNIPAAERPLRTLNLLEKGKITKVQRGKMSQLEKIIIDIMEVADGKSV